MFSKEMKSERSQSQDFFDNKKINKNEQQEQNKPAKNTGLQSRRLNNIQNEVPPLWEPSQSRP